MLRAVFPFVKSPIDRTSIKLFAIGDPDQSIYSMMGADPSYLNKLVCREDISNFLQLDLNYRATKNIIQICKNILTPTCNYDSELLDQPNSTCCRVYKITKLEQSAVVISKLVQSYSEKYKIPLHEIAVLHSRRPSKASATEGIKFVASMLDTRSVPYTIDQHPLYDRRKYLIHWLEELAVWCLSGWTIGDNESIHRKCSFEEILRQWITINHGSFSKVEPYSELREKLTSVLWEIKGQNLPLSEWLDYIQDRLELDKVLYDYSNEHPDDVAEFENLREICTQGKGLAEWDLKRFAHLNSAIQLTTLHSSKGMQFEAVIIVGIERLWNNDESRRLLYVGATRAKKQLSIIYRNVWPKDAPTTPKYISDLCNKCSTLSFFTHYDV